MKLFSRFRKQEATPVSQAKSASFLFGPSALQMTNWNYNAYATEGYGRNAIVNACIEKIATAASSVDIQAFTKSDDGKLEEEENHPILALLSKPNPAMTGSDFLGNLIRYYLIGGAGYVLGTGVDPKSFKQGILPKELYLLSPGCMTVLPGSTVLPVGYEYRTASGQKVIYPVNQISGRSQVMMKKTFNPIDQWNGLSPMTAAAMGIDVFNESMEWNMRLLQNEGRPSGALTIKDKDGKVQSLDATQYARLQAQIEEQMSGAANSGRPLLLEGGMEWQEMSLNPKDMDHKENQLQAARWICSVYGVPPQLVGVPGESTYSNYEQARQALWTDTVLPLLGSVLGSLNDWLGNMMGDGVILWYDEEMITALEPLRKLREERVNNSTFRAINEKRSAMSLDDVVGGDVILVEQSKIPLEMAGESLLAEPGSAAATEPSK